MPSLYQRYLLPGVVFQSVLIGGAYATGREIVEYGAKFGAQGVWAIGAIFAGFSLLSVLTYEFARRFELHDYRSFARALVGPLWPAFDLLYVAMAIVIIAVVSAASASIARQVLGWSYGLGILVVTLLVAAISAAGRAAIERFKSAGTLLLYGGYLLFSWAVLADALPAVSRVFDSGDVSHLGPAPILGVVGTGILYVGYNLATLPPTLFTLDRLGNRREAIWAGLVTGLLATLPFALTYLAVLAHYPDESVLGAPVPWLVMLERSAGPPLVVLFALVVLWTLVETCTGMLHALSERIDADLVERGRRPLSAWQIAGLTSGVLVISALLSRLGIIALVAKGYAVLAYGFLALFAAPLVTIGLWRLLRAPRQARRPT